MIQVKAYCKKHETKDGLVVAACDEDLKRKTLENGYKVSESFYGKELIDFKELDALVKECVHGNFLGANIASYLTKKGLIPEESVVSLAGVPNALLLKVRP